jgi:hypothetical protein
MLPGNDEGEEALMRKWPFVALLLIGATILGSTVLREPIARAAQSVDANIIGPLDGHGNVRVHEQGTATVALSPGANGVTSADLTTVLFKDHLFSGVETPIIDTRSAKQIRVFIRPEICSAPYLFSVFVRDTDGSMLGLLDSGNVAACTETTRTYKVPGPGIQVVSTSAPGDRSQIAVLGRGN